MKTMKFDLLIREEWASTKEDLCLERRRLTEGVNLPVHEREDRDLNSLLIIPRSAQSATVVLVFMLLVQIYHRVLLLQRICEKRGGLTRHRNEENHS